MSASMSTGHSGSSSASGPAGEVASLERCLKLVTQVRASSGGLWRALREGAKEGQEGHYGSPEEAQKKFLAKLRLLLDNVSKNIT